VAETVRDIESTVSVKTMNSVGADVEVELPDYGALPRHLWMRLR
jgi:hypothetical protein